VRRGLLQCARGLDEGRRRCVALFVHGERNPKLRKVSASFPWMLGGDRSRTFKPTMALFGGIRVSFPGVEYDGK